jgi:hypothetical protein
LPAAKLLRLLTHGPAHTADPLSTNCQPHRQTTNCQLNSFTASSHRTRPSHDDVPGRPVLARPDFHSLIAVLVSSLSLSFSPLCVLLQITHSRTFNSFLSDRLLNDAMSFSLVGRQRAAWRVAATVRPRTSALVAGLPIAFHSEGHASQSLSSGRPRPQRHFSTQPPLRKSSQPSGRLRSFLSILPDQQSSITVLQCAYIPCARRHRWSHCRRGDVPLVPSIWVA